jgi:hypothetical protein
MEIGVEGLGTQHMKSSRIGLNDILKVNQMGKKRYKIVCNTIAFMFNGRLRNRIPQFRHFAGGNREPDAIPGVSVPSTTNPPARAIPCQISMSGCEGFHK